MTALSIRQPWAWLIVNGHKNIENRTWYSKFFGPLLIHAGKAMTMKEYKECQNFISTFSDIKLPEPHLLSRGGIVGRCDMAGSVTESDSPWFVGPVGFVFSEARPLPFTVMNGQLGLFDVSTYVEQ